MLKLKYLVEDFDLARHALAHWLHDEATLAERLSWFRISSNAVYPFDRDGRLCFLRLSPAAEKSSAELLGELDFLAFLQRRGYPAMKPVPAMNGEILVPVESACGLWYASAFEGVPGQPLEDLPMTSMLAMAYGAALGRLHVQAMAYHSPIRRRTHADVLAWMAHTLEKHGAPKTVQAEAAEVARLLAALPRTRESYGLVHYDFEPDNVFWDGTGCRVIDFEDGMLHFFAVDVVQALDELEEEYRAAFLGGYRDACPQAQVSPADFLLMRRFRDLYSYARLLHSLSEKPEPEPEWMPRLVKRLEMRRDELERSILLR